MARSYSIVLLARCEANYTFTTVDIGAYCSQSNGSILWHSGFGQRLLSGKLDLPEDSNLPGTCTKFFYFMVGDAAYPGLYIYLNLRLTSNLNFFLSFN